MQPAQFLRRRAAAEYLKARFGFGSERTLAKLACTGGGPIFRKASESIVLYALEDLDAWALAQIGSPRRSTSEGGSGGPGEAANASRTRGRPPKSPSRQALR
jgi:hypothetical protein